MARLERRLSLPSGYRLVTDLSSLPCSPASLSPRRRKDNLVTRGGSVRVRQVPIILEEDGEEVESSTSSLSSASIVTQSGRASLPSNTAQQANKTAYLVREEVVGTRDCPLHGCRAARRASTSTYSGRPSGISPPRKNSTCSIQGKPLYEKFSSLTLKEAAPRASVTRRASLPGTPSLGRKESLETGARIGAGAAVTAGTVGKKPSSCSPLRAPELLKAPGIPINANSPREAPLNHRPRHSLPSRGPLSRGPGRRSLRGEAPSLPPTHQANTFSSLSRTHTVFPILPSSLPDYFRPVTPSLASAEEEERATTTSPSQESLGGLSLQRMGRSLPSQERVSSPSPSLQSILKPADKRRPSQQHRVGFLDSLGGEAKARQARMC